MAGRGGRRPGAGRKSRAEELGLQQLLAECITVAQRKKMLRELAKDAISKDFEVREPSRKLALAYLYGTPKQMVELSGEMPLLVLDGRPEAGPARAVKATRKPVEKPVRVKKAALAKK